jgi:hypothetical protein
MGRRNGNARQTYRPSSSGAELTIDAMSGRMKQKQESSEQVVASYAITMALDLATMQRVKDALVSQAKQKNVQIRTEQRPQIAIVTPEEADAKMRRDHMTTFQRYDFAAFKRDRSTSVRWVVDDFPRHWRRIAQARHLPINGPIHLEDTTVSLRTTQYDRVNRGTQISVNLQDTDSDNAPWSGALEALREQYTKPDTFSGAMLSSERLRVPVATVLASYADTKDFFVPVLEETLDFFMPCESPRIQTVEIEL